MKKFFKGLGIFIGVIVLLFIALIIFSPSGSDVEEVTTDGSNAKETEKKENPEDKVYNVGDVISIDGLEVSIISAEFTNPTEYGKAEKGKVLTLTVESTNNSDNSAFVDNTDFNIYDVEGNKHDFYYSYDESMISGDINKGKKLTGKLYFDVPEAQEYELIYSPTFSWDDIEIKFNIKPVANQ